MHLYEYLLRDLIATERNSSPDGFIMLHDCCPFDHGMTTRDLDNLPDGPWTGDVWKIIPILQAHRPDLKIDVLDCRTTGLVVLSNNINIINRLAQSNCRELILVGGTVRPSDGAIVGEDAVEFISRYKVDYAIIGASSLDTDGAILDFDAREVAVARALLRNARKSILVCDGSKLATAAPIRICDIAELDYMVTDQPLPAPFQAAARAGHTQLISAKDAS